MNESDRTNRFGFLTSMNDRNRILYSDESRPPTYSVQRYVTYLKTYVADTGKTTASRNASEADKKKDRKQESVNPLSYFLRKLKLDLKMSYSHFVSEFVEAPYNGLKLLLALLKNIHGASGKTVGSVPRSRGNGTLNIEEYKQHMVDELDCLLCIKYTMRIAKSLDVITEDSAGLYTVVSCCISRYSKSRIAALEILSLLITGPPSVDKVLDAFTAIRIQYSETTRFKMLVNMMDTRGVVNVVFQINTLRLLNDLLNNCKSPNMRVFLQYEMEEAGLDLNNLQQNAHKPGLEYDDLNKQIHEWRTRYIDFGIRKDFPSQAMSDYLYDQQYGNRLGPQQPLLPGHANWMSLNQGIESNSGRGRWQNRQDDKQTNMADPSSEIIFYKGQDVYTTSRTDLHLKQFIGRNYEGDVTSGYENKNNITSAHKQQQRILFERYPASNTTGNNFTHSGDMTRVPHNTQSPDIVMYTGNPASIHNAGKPTTFSSSKYDNENTKNTNSYDDNWALGNSDITRHSISRNGNHGYSSNRNPTKYDSGVSVDISDCPPSRKPDARFVWTLESHSQSLFYTGPASDDESEHNSKEFYSRRPNSEPLHLACQSSAIDTSRTSDSPNNNMASRNPNDLEADVKNETGNKPELPCSIQEYKPKNMDHNNIAPAYSNTIEKHANWNANSGLKSDDKIQIQNEFSPPTLNVVTERKAKSESEKRSSPTKKGDAAEQNPGDYDDEVNTVLLELDRALEIHGGGKDSVKSTALVTNKTFMAYI